ncbi:hypothetical protein EVAR_29109_1 [Eumeta japonica]|uniref:RNA-directed DNA polymerase from mobile element jockey n=1 Tax=Eumeta variegata TaxID=151549 RepID=A0A4C1VNZ0_EUMVA|nr:hypothetical protein EVAR_29109_1 [Eumeta japonica]
MLDANIPWQRNYKYLGVTLDKNLHFRDHIERVRNSALFYKARLGAVLGYQPKLPYSTRPLLTASGRVGGKGREPTRDGFLRHPMPRRLPPGVVHSACHAPSALACAVHPHSVKLSKSSDLSSDSSRLTK